MNLQTTARLLGTLFMVLAVAMVIPAPVGYALHESGTVWAFLVAAAITGGAGFGLRYWGRKVETIHRREAIIVVAAGWVLCGAFGALPFLLSGAIPSVTDAYFETVSGFTTTGASILTAIEPLPRSVLLWRSMIQWLGGMGIVVLFIAVFPQLGVGARNLFRSEVPGPITTGLRPKIRETASVLWRIYLGITVAEVLLLMLCGMTLYDAVNHALTTMATGGFSTRNTSIAAYDSVAIELTITFFMFLAGVNFGLYHTLLRRQWRKVLEDVELRTYALVVGVATLLLTVNLLLNGSSLGAALRGTVFTSVSIMTTTGYGTADFGLWPAFSQVILVMLMFIGGSAGSTAGGMKVIRTLVLFKAALVELVHEFRPNVVQPVRLGRMALKNNVVRGVLAFGGMYTATFVGGTLVMAAMGLDFTTSYSSVVATLSNIGPGLGSVGPTANFAHIPLLGKWFLSLLMILGRLEILTVLAIFTPMFWSERTVRGTS